VRVLIWRNPKFGDTFCGSEALSYLQKNKFQFPIRWDDSPHLHHSHHQKCWIIDAGNLNSTELFLLTYSGDNKAIGYVGGMNLRRSSIMNCQHNHRTDGKMNIHDVYARLEGDCVNDIQVQFIQRYYLL
jgi:phosphatidylserine/phosphatidylglycerophosphate/cardiolipin synthase-like enzyme